MVANSLLFIHFTMPIICIAMHIPCVTRDGPSVTNQFEISSISCESNETMVSCGVQGIHNPGGAWIDNGACGVLHGGTDTRGVTAKARCCAFPPDADIEIAIVSSTTDGTYATATCPPHTTLVGCQVYWVSGTYDKLMGVFTGSPTTNTEPQTGAWIATTNQCHARCYSGETVKAGAVCLSVNTSSYAMNCETNAVFVGSRDNPGSLPCESGYIMTGCSPLFTRGGSTIDHWYVRDDLCYCSGDNQYAMYRNAICCELTMLGVDPYTTVYPMLSVSETSTTVSNTFINATPTIAMSSTNTIDIAISTDIITTQMLSTIHKINEKEAKVDPETTALENIETKAGREIKGTTDAVRKYMFAIGGFVATICILLCFCLIMRRYIMHKKTALQVEGMIEATANTGNTDAISSVNNSMQPESVIDVVQNHDGSGNKVNTVHLQPDNVANAEYVAEDDDDDDSLWDAGCDDKPQNETKGKETMTAHCTDCGLLKCGKYYESDGLFYCDGCWQYYGNDTRGNATKQ